MKKYPYYRIERVIATDGDLVESQLLSEFDEKELEGRLHRLIDAWGATESNTVWTKKAKRILLTGNDNNASNT